MYDLLNEEAGHQLYPVLYKILSTVRLSGWSLHTFISCCKFLLAWRTYESMMSSIYLFLVICYNILLVVLC